MGSHAYGGASARECGDQVCRKMEEREMWKGFNGRENGKPGFWSIESFFAHLKYHGYDNHATSSMRVSADTGSTTLQRKGKETYVSGFNERSSRNGFHGPGYQRSIMFMPSTQ